MEFQVINRNRNAVIPEGMFKLCGMEDAKLISMVQLNGGILLMPESVSTYQLLMLCLLYKSDAADKLFVSRYLRHRRPPAHTAPVLQHPPDVRRWQERPPHQ